MKLDRSRNLVTIPGNNPQVGLVPGVREKMLEIGFTGLTRSPMVAERLHASLPYQAVVLWKSGAYLQTLWHRTFGVWSRSSVSIRNR